MSTAAASPVGLSRVLSAELARGAACSIAIGATGLGLMLSESLPLMVGAAALLGAVAIALLFKTRRAELDLEARELSEILLLGIGAFAGLGATLSVQFYAILLSSAGVDWRTLGENPLPNLGLGSELFKIAAAALCTASVYFFLIWVNYQSLPEALAEKRRVIFEYLAMAIRQGLAFGLIGVGMTFVFLSVIAEPHRWQWAGLGFAAFFLPYLIMTKEEHESPRKFAARIRDVVTARQLRLSLMWLLAMSVQLGLTAAFTGMLLAGKSWPVSDVVTLFDSFPVVAMFFELAIVFGGFALSAMLTEGIVKERKLTIQKEAAAAAE